MEKSFSSKKKELKLFQVSKQDGKISSKKKELKLFQVSKQDEKSFSSQKITWVPTILKKYFRYICYAFFLIFLFLSAIFLKIILFFVFFF